MKIGQKRVSPIAQPFDRPSDAFCRPGDQHKLRAGVVADPEIAADIARDHAHGILCDTECSGYVVPLPDHAAAGAGVDSELCCSRVVGTKRRAQFHRHAGDAVYRRLQPHDMRRACEGILGRLPIARLGVDAQI
jgi:hypothetical protein